MEKECEGIEEKWRWRRKGREEGKGQGGWRRGEKRGDEEDGGGERREDGENTCDGKEKMGRQRDIQIIEGKEKF